MKRNRNVWCWLWVEIPSQAQNIFEFEELVSLGPLDVMEDLR